MSKQNEISAQELWAKFKNKEITAEEYIEISLLRIKLNKNRK